MIFTFLRHQFKSFWRSPNVGKSLATRIVMGLLVLYILLHVVVAAFFLETIIKKNCAGTGSAAGV